MAQARQIRLESVSRSKPTQNGQVHWVLNELSIVIESGQSIGIIGRSGGGKTTLLRLLNRLEDPDTGRILYGDDELINIEPTSLRRRIVLVNQRSVMFPGSVLENIMLPDTLTAKGKGDPERARRAMATVRLADDLTGRDAAALSVGQQGRVQLARSLYLEPEVLLLDESTANLDPQVAKDILDELHESALREGRTLIHVSHEPDKLRRCMRLLLLDEGKILLDDVPGKVLDDPRSPAAALLARGE